MPKTSVYIILLKLSPEFTAELAHPGIVGAVADAAQAGRPRLLRNWWPWAKRRNSRKRLSTDWATCCDYGRRAFYARLDLSKILRRGCLCPLKLSHYRCASGRVWHGSEAVFGRGVFEDIAAG
jgi:hypothetical protein